MLIITENYTHILKKFFTITLLVFLASCSTSTEDIEKEIEIEKEVPEEGEVWEIISVPSSTQRDGDIQTGKEYLFSGDYMSSGIPYAVYLAIYGESSENVLNRTGDNAIIAYDYTALTSNGARVVAPNCLNCHSAKINNEYVVGLGNHSGNFTVNRAALEPLLTRGVNQAYGEDSPEAMAYEQFKKSIIAIGQKTQTESIGVNSANKITEVLISHRDKNTLEWNDTPYVDLDNEVIPTDVPAWWLLKKKYAMFYTALGRKDFCKSFIGAALLTLDDVEKAKEVNEKMPDVLAYLNSIKPPKYPYTIDNTLANTGKPIFDNKCSSCHGTYGNTQTYPNSLVALKTIKTDPELSNHYTENSEINTYFFEWFNTGYMGTDANNIQLKAEGGYIAPPLDGIWATAPYLHNGSVPTLEDVLNSTNRPELWSRTFIDTDYDQNKVGWNYVVESTKQNIKTYDTTLKGYSNSGHTFGDELTNAERLAVLEYLKTL